MSADNNRRIESIIRFGLIAEVDHAQAKARVKCGEILTDFIPFIAMRSGTTKNMVAANTRRTMCHLGGKRWTDNRRASSQALHTKQPKPFSRWTRDRICRWRKNHLQPSKQRFGCDRNKNSQHKSRESNQYWLPLSTLKAMWILTGIYLTTGKTTSKGAISTQSNVSASGDIKGGEISLRNHVHVAQGEKARTSKATA